MSKVQEFIMTWLDPVGVVIGLVIALPVLWTWYEVVIGRKRRERRWHRQLRQQPGVRPAILIVDLLAEKDIRGSVEAFRHKHENRELESIPDDRIITVRRDARICPDDMPGLMRDIRRAAADCIASGADTIHFFYAGPATVAAIVGAELANTTRVLIYQHDNTGYHNFGPLRCDA